MEATNQISLLESVVIVVMFITVGNLLGFIFLKKKNQP